MDKTINMKKNIGASDTITRIIIALILLALWGLKIITGTPAIFLPIASGVLVLTVLADYCPLYGVLGISSCEKESD